MELAERLDSLLHQSLEGQKQLDPKATVRYEFDDRPNGMRRLRLHLSNGDVISGIGKNNEEAIAAVEARIR